MPSQGGGRGDRRRRRGRVSANGRVASDGAADDEVDGARRGAEGRDVIVVSKVAFAPAPFAAGPPQRSVPAGAAAQAPAGEGQRDTTRATDAVRKDLRTRRHLGYSRVGERVERTEIPRLILPDALRISSACDDHHADPGHPPRHARARSLFALLLLSALAFFAYTVSRRVQLLTLGAGSPDDRLDRPLGAALARRRRTGSSSGRCSATRTRASITPSSSAGFSSSTVRTLDARLRGPLPGAGLPFLPAGFWEGYLLLKDVVLVTTLAGVVLALGRRHVFKKERLDPSLRRRPHPPPDRLPDGDGPRRRRARRWRWKQGDAATAAPIAALRRPRRSNALAGSPDLFPF